MIIIGVLFFQLSSIGFPSRLFFSQMFCAFFVEVWRVCAVHFEPPLADEVGLLENGAVGTEEGNFPAVIADVEDLERYKNEVNIIN